MSLHLQLLVQHVGRVLGTVRIPRQLRLCALGRRLSGMQDVTGHSGKPCKTSMVAILSEDKPLSSAAALPPEPPC